MSKAAELANLIGNINAGGGDNFIINGGMTVSQRGTSFTNPSSNDYCLDRYAIQWSGISPQFTVSQDTSTPDGEGFYKSLKIATSNTQTPSGGQGAFMYQKVEGNNISNIMFGTSNAKRLVLSFYVKSSKTGTYSVGFHNNGFDRNLVSEYTISSADTWEKKTITFVGDTSGTWTTDNTIGMGVYFHLSNGDGSNTTSTLDSWQSGNNYLGSQNQVNLWDSSSATWFITGVQLEIGQNPTEFIHEPFEKTLHKCKRYYEHNYEAGYYPADGVNYSQTSSPFLGNCYHSTSGGKYIMTHHKFEVEKRASPTVTLYRVAGLGGGSTANRWDWFNYSGGWDETDDNTEAGEITSKHHGALARDSGANVDEALTIAGGWDASAEL